MSYGVKWRVNFVARNGDSYRIDILQNGYTGNDITLLRGAENPIETEEDNTDDLFCPIRKQTGTLRIADNGFDLDGNPFDYTELLPTDALDIQVQLYQSNTLRWIGYIRADELTSPIFEAVSIREYHLMCPLGMLYDAPFTFSNDDSQQSSVPTIGAILHNALSSVGIDWETVAKTNNLPNRQDLTSRVSLTNFCDVKKATYNSSNTKATWNEGTWGNVLEEICKFWGWTLYSRGLTVFLLSRAENVPFTHFQFADLTNATEYTLYDDSGTQIQIHDLDELDYASTNHNESAANGKRNIKITANVNPKDAIISPYLNELEYNFDNTIHYSAGYNYVQLTFKMPSGAQTATVTQDNFVLYVNNVLQTGRNAPFVVEMNDSWQLPEEGVSDKTDITLKNDVVVWWGTYEPTNPNQRRVFSARTMEDIVLQAGSMISITATTRRDLMACDPYNYNTPIPSGTTQLPLNLILRVGGKYWSGTYSSGQYNGSWSDSPAILVANTDEAESGKIATTRNLLDPHKGASGYCIPINSAMCGRVELAVLYQLGNESQTDFKIHLVLDNIKVAVFNQDSVVQPTTKDTQEYEGVASTDFHEDLDVDLQMASGDNNKYGVGQVYTTDYNLLTTVPFRKATSTSSMSPESRLLQKMQSAYSSVARKCVLEIMDDVNVDLPNASFDNYWAGTDAFSLLCCSHNWRDATMQLTIVNK
ncbi:MAG: hypothetical protein J6R34_01970 [Clostridia bacterium]|nr:hypothetical protein [Clostridia bacterium]